MICLIYYEMNYFISMKINSFLGKTSNVYYIIAFDYYITIIIITIHILKIIFNQKQIFH